MRERLALLDGRLEIQSVRGRGTRVAASVPLPPAAAGSMAPATAT
jgi:two-component system sensor histidine kinase DesK